MFEYEFRYHIFFTFDKVNLRFCLFGCFGRRYVILLAVPIFMIETTKMGFIECCKNKFVLLNTENTKVNNVLFWT